MHVYSIGVAIKPEAGPALCEGVGNFQIAKKEGVPSAESASDPAEPFSKSLH